MILTHVMQSFVLHWGEMGNRWGMNRSVVQIHALLYLSHEPISAETIADTLHIARSNVSNSLKEFQNWELVSVAHQRGDRRAHFVAKSDIWDILTTIADGRKRREIDLTLTLLRDCATQLSADSSTRSIARQRIENMLEFTTDFSGWYEQMRSLPNRTLFKLMHMGTKIRKLISTLEHGCDQSQVSTTDPLGSSGYSNTVGV
jgi:DNA-binding transcriptional regulator GbsR (MarR family)